MAEDLELLRLRVRVKRQREAKARASQQPSAPQQTGVIEGGAPPGVRAMVGAAPHAAQLPMVQSYFPDAFRDPVSKRTIYPDPEKPEQFRYYNPPGLDVGDILSVTKEVAMGAAAIPGAIAGVPAGGFPGAIVGSGLAAAGTQEAIEQAAMRMRGVQDPRSGLEHAVDIGSAGVGTATGGGLGPAASMFGKRGLRRMFRGGEEGLSKTRAAIDAFGSFDATPSVGQATQRYALDSIEGFLSRAPGGSGPFRKKVHETTQKLQEHIANRAASLSGKTLEPEIAGQTIQKGLNNWAGRFNEKAGTLYDKLDQFVPTKSPVSVNNTMATLGDLAGPIEGAEAIGRTALMSNPMIKALYSAVQQDAAQHGLPYGVLKEMRSRVGRLLSGGGMITDLPKKDLKALYGALSEDMRLAAVAGGGDAAEQAFSRANNYYKAGLNRIDNFYDTLSQKVEPEKVFTLLERGGKDGASKIRAIRKGLTKEEWDVVSATTLKRLGKTTGSQLGDFSIETFTTRWGNLSSEAQDAFFGGVGTLRADLDKIAKATDIFRENARAFANPAGTAGQLVGQTLMFGGAGSMAMGQFGVAGTLGAAVGLMHGASRLMTSPKFVRWLAQSTTVKPTGLAAHIGRLGGIAQFSDPETREAILEYIQVIGQTPEKSQQPAAG